MLFDSHAHLDDDRFNADLDEVIRRARAAGASRVDSRSYSISSPTNAPLPGCLDRAACLRLSLANCAMRAGREGFGMIEYSSARIAGTLHMRTRMRPGT